MKKIVVALAAVVVVMLAVVGCNPVNSNYAQSGTYTFTLKAQFEKDATQIGLPSIDKAQFKVDSFLNAYAMKNKLGVDRFFSAAGTNPVDMQNMMHNNIKKTFDSLVGPVSKVDYHKVLDSCKAFYGGEMRILFVVTPYSFPNTIMMRDTVVEKQRLNFVPQDMSRWELEAEDASYYDAYVFEPNNSVALIHNINDAQSTYVIDPATGIFTVQPVSGSGEPIAQHTLTFKTEGYAPCFLSSMNDKLYFLVQ